MELRQLRYFQSVAEELSFSKAAEKLHIAQPAISRSVRELELELGTELLRRTKRSVKLTPAGSVLLHQVGVILGICDETIRKVQRTAKGQEGELRLGYIGPPTQPFLARLLGEFQKRHPNVTVYLEERTPERVWEMVTKGRLDLGLTRPVMASDRIPLDTLLLRKETLCAVMPAGHSLSACQKLKWAQLQKESLIALARREGVSLHDRILYGCQQAGFFPRFAHIPSIVGTVLTYVEAGAGVGVVPDSIASLDTGSRLVVRPLYPLLTVDLVMVWSGGENNPAGTAFRRLVSEWLEKGRLWTSKEA